MDTIMECGLKIAILLANNEKLHLKLPQRGKLGGLTKQYSNTQEQSENIL